MSVDANVAAKQEAQRAATALSGLLAPVRGSIRVGVTLQVVASIATIAPYVAIAELGRVFLTGDPVDRGRVWWVAGGLAVALVARVALGSAALTVTHFADLRLQALLRHRIAAHLGRLPLGWFTRHSSGVVRKATQNDIEDIHYLVAHGAVETTAAIVTPIVGVAYLIGLDWRLALLGIVPIPVYAIVYATMARGMTGKMAEMNRGVAAISATIVEFVSGIAVVKTFGRVGQAHARFRRAATDFGDAYAGWVRPMLRTDALATIGLSAPTILLVTLAGGTGFVAAGWVTPVEVVVAGLVAMMLPVSIQTISFSWQARQQASAAALRVAALLDTPPLPAADHPARPTDASVVLDNVSFRYDGTANLALDGVSLRLPAGGVTALVGASGSGKSTLASLVPRFHDVGEGRVLVGGVDVRDIDQTVLYRQVGFVLQEVQLLGLSVADNIRLARPDATLEQVRAAARAAQIDERLLALPRGYDSVVGHDAQLSGGEAQRVSIARAILADPPILVLDEATAFADPESEAAIQDALSRLTVGRTLLVIAHRLGSIVDADQIAVLERGRLVQLGTHAELAGREGAYAQLWRDYQEGAMATEVAA